MLEYIDNTSAFLIGGGDITMVSHDMPLDIGTKEEGILIFPDYKNEIETISLIPISIIVINDTVFIKCQLKQHLMSDTLDDTKMTLRNKVNDIVIAFIVTISFSSEALYNLKFDKFKSLRDMQGFDVELNEFDGLDIHSTENMSPALDYMKIYANKRIDEFNKSLLNYNQIGLEFTDKERRIFIKKKQNT